MGRTGMRREAMYKTWDYRLGRAAFWVGGNKSLVIGRAVLIVSCFLIGESVFGMEQVNKL